MVPTMHPCSARSSSSHNQEVGLRFKQTKAELLGYLWKKNRDHSFSSKYITECDIYKFYPDELSGKFQVGVEDMYFYTQWNRKHKGGSYADRTVGKGSWKASDGHTIVDDQGKVLGYERSLKFYMNKKEKTEWMMKEYYRIDKVDPPTMQTTSEASRGKRKRVAATQDDQQEKMNGYVLCRIYKKKSGAKKTNKAPVSEDIAEDPTSYPLPCYKDQTSNIDNECLPTVKPGYTSANIPPVVDTPSVDFNSNFRDYGKPSTSSCRMPCYDNEETGSNILFLDQPVEIGQEVDGWPANFGNNQALISSDLPPGYTSEYMFGNPYANIPPVVGTSSVDFETNFHCYEQPSTSSCHKPCYDSEGTGSEIHFSNKPNEITPEAQDNELVNAWGVDKLFAYIDTEEFDWLDWHQSDPDFHKP